MSTLSTIAAFDDLRRNHAVLSDGVAEEGNRVFSSSVFCLY